MRFREFIERSAEAVFDRMSGRKVSLGKTDGEEVNAYLSGSGSQTLAVVAGLHGDEPAGPVALSRWTPPSGVKVVAVPLVNPDGYEHDRREDGDRKDPNRHFCPDSLSGINKLVFDFLVAQKPDLLVTLHEDSSKRGFYLYVSREGHPATRPLMELASDYFTIQTGDSMYGDRMKSGVVVSTPENMGVKHRCALENNLADKLGIDYFTLETPSGSAPLGRRVEFTAKALDLITSVGLTKS